MPSIELPTAAAASDLRPLSIGELIDRTFQLYRRNFVQLFLFSCLVYSPWFVLGVMMAFFGWNKEGPEHLLQNVVLAVACVPFYVVIFSVMKLGEGAMVHYVSELYMGRKPLLQEAFASLRTRGWPLIWTTLLKSGVLLLVLLLPVIPLVILIRKVGPFVLGGSPVPGWTVIELLGASLVLLVPGLILAVRYLLTNQTIMLEGKAGWAAVRRSSELIRYDPKLGFMYWGETRISVILLVIVVASILIGIVGSVPALVSRIPAIMRGNFTAMDMDLPTGVKIVTHLINFMGTSLVLPLYAISETAFYYDVRVRKEGFDLEALAGSIEAGKEEI